MMGFNFGGLPEAEQSDDADVHFANIVDNKLYYRSFTDNLPESYVYITNNGGSVTFWIDTAIVRDGESPIVAIFYERTLKVCDSLLDFVELITRPDEFYKIFE